MWLSSVESRTWEEPRRAVEVSQHQFIETKRGALLLDIAPSFWLQWPALPGIVDNSEHQLILVSARFAGESVLRIDEWPCFVYILLPKGGRSLPRVLGPRIAVDDFYVIAWAELYESYSAINEWQQGTN